MGNKTIHHQIWWNTPWKWVVPVAGLLLVLIITYFTSGMSKTGTDFAQAYADTQLYEQALKKVNSNSKVTNLIGELEPLDKFAILEGDVQYTNDNQNVKLSVRITGIKGKAIMDLEANKLKAVWNYTKIKVRIKTPPEKKQDIDIDTSP